MKEEGPAGHRIVEHTADIGLRVWAKDVPGLFEQAAMGLAALIADPREIAQVEERDISVGAVDIEEALVGFLQEILFEFEIGRFLTAAVSVTEAGAKGVRARIRGEAFDARRHSRRMDVKAVTYHDLRVTRIELADGGERWVTTIIFDI